MNDMRKIVLLLLLFTASQIRLYAQAIPIGSWRSHTDNSNAVSLTLFDNKIFCRSTAGLYFYDLEDESITTVSPADGLSGTSPTALLSDVVSGQLFISYETGLIDIIDADLNIRTFTALFDANITQSKRINDLSADDETIYVSTDFGVILINPITNQIKDSYINLSEEGNPLKINSAISTNDTLYLSTTQGLLIGALDGVTNLKDFRNWGRTNVDSTTNILKSIPLDNGLLALNAAGEVYDYTNKRWNIASNDNQVFNNLYLQNGMVRASAGNSIFDFNNGTFTPQITIGVAGAINESITANAQTYLAHATQGLALLRGSTISSIIPNGPRGETTSLHQLEDFTLHFSSAANGFSYFTNGRWFFTAADEQNQTLPIFKDATLDLTTGNGILLSAEAGLYSWDTENTTKIQIPDNVSEWTFLATDNFGIPWALCKSEGNYVVYNIAEEQLSAISVNGTVEVRDYTIAPNGDHYMATTGGVTVLNPENDVVRTLINVIGNGNLPANSITGFAEALDGNLWIGTTEGICYFNNYASVLAGENTDAVVPIFEGFFLFDDIGINSISIDGGNRLWVGNRDGLWLFDEAIQENLMRFTPDNSPLVNQNIEQVVINPINGEAFMKAGQQLISYRTASSRATIGHTAVKVFPNPVFLSEDNQVSITGLAFNNEVMVTDLAGNLIFKGKANGGTFNWNLQNYSGFRARPGVYLVFSVDASGEDTYQTKFVISN